MDKLIAGYFSSNNDANKSPTMIKAASVVPPDDYALAQCIDARNILKPEKYTIHIGNCEHIYLTQKGIDIEVDVHIQNFDKIDEIVINGRRFVRSREDEKEN